MSESPWLDGPGLVCWLEEKGLPSTRALGCAAQRRLSDWRNGGRANVYTVDELLTRLGYGPLSELPDRLWL